MDNSYENELEFLDFSNLDESGIDELTAILEPNAITEGLKLPWDRGENDYNELSEEIQIQEEPNTWHHEMDEYYIKYAMPQNPSSNVFSHVQPAYTFNPYLQFIRQDPNICCNTGPEVGILPYPVLSGIHISNESQDMALMRDGGRRGRSNKNYNRNITYSNEMNPRYIDNHCQFPVNMPFSLAYAYVQSPHPTQQHPATGQGYTSSMYPTTFPPQTHQFDTLVYPSTNSKHNHQFQNVLPQTNGESTQMTNHKIYEKNVQNVNTTKPSIHQTHDDINNSSQANIVTTVIVNNSDIDSSTNDIDENPTVINNSNNKNYLKIEQHTFVSKINENCKGAEKNDIPYFNVKSRIEVKQNGNDNKEYNETISDLKTPTTSMTSKPAAKSINEEFQSKEVKDVPVTENTLEIDEPQVSTSSFSNAFNMSWANVVKNSETHNVGTNKPMACIAPNNVISTNNDQIEQSSVDKSSLAPKSNQNKLFPVAEDVSQKCDVPLENMPLHTDVPRLHCDDPIIYRMGEFLLSYQMDKQTVSLLPRGLTNRSNYCYINSILQALLACPPFYNLLMALPYSKSPSRHSPSPLIDNMIKFVREFSPLSEGARLARKDRAQKRNEDAVIDIQSGVPFEPSYIYTILKNTSSPGVFSVEGRQEDAEEFLSCLLNGISDEMLELMKLANNNDQKSIECVDANFNYNQGEEEWKVMGPKNKGSITRSTDFGRTPLSDIFRGQLRSRVSRASEQATDYVQPFFTLQLDIEKAESVKTALEILVGKDPLEGMTCSKTKQKIEAWKQVTLEELPVILILHLKWFDYKPDGCSKILKSVEFPVDLKFDNKLISSNAKTKISQKQKQYKLFAVTYHDGKEATKGHYVTDAFHVGYGGWVRYDDSSLKGVSEANVLNPLPPRVPYLLYYRRCDTIGNNQSNNVKTR